MNFKQQSRLTRNAREWLEEAKFVMHNYNIDSCKMLYTYFVEKDKHQPRVENVFPEIDWEIVWNNISSSFLLSEDRSKIYELVNDLIPNKKKLVEYGIRRMSDVCDECQVVDSNEHRLKFCPKTEDIRSWVEVIIRQRMKLEYVDLEMFLTSQLDRKCFRQRSALWLVCHYYSYVLKSYPKCSLFVFKKGIRECRWNKREEFRRNFESYLNIC